MSEPFLILHKVRGKPAFDIATQMPCPLCNQGEYPMCIECNESGVWWIIPTSGHRAYPYWHTSVKTDGESIWFGEYGTVTWFKPPMPDDILDHYSINSTPPKPKSLLSDLLSTLGLKAPTIKRRA